MPSEKQKKGYRKEANALSFLEQQGLRLVEKNFHCKAGELDLILLDGDILSFTEVRYREPGALVSALESVTRPKQLRIIRAADYYVRTHATWQQHYYRFDLVTYDGDNTRYWIKDAFRVQ